MITVNTGGAPGALRAAGLAALLLILAGCAGPGPERPARDGEHAACRTFYQEMDEQVTSAGVRDGIGAPPPAFPYLRATRFLGAFAGDLADPDVRADWLDRARALDDEARRLEWRNLPASRRDQVSLPHGAAGIREALATCGPRLRRADRLEADDGPWRAAADALAVPDDYITWHRAAGVYPLSRWFVGAGVARWQAGVRDAFSNTVAGEPAALRYRPRPDPARPQEARQTLAAAGRNALGWPQLTDDQWQAVFDAFAPVIELPDDARHNRMGRPIHEPSGQPDVAVDEPVVYTQATATRHSGRTLVQLNYTWWFSERPVDHWFDLLGGRLDGLTLRLTLAPDGRLLLVETMHNCGCYHQHYPVQGLTPRAEPDYAEPPLILPGPEAPVAGERLRVRLEPGTHYVSHLAFDAVSGRGTAYGLRDYDRLRSLPAPDGGRRSLFRPDGLVPGTERGERWFLWVSGVPEPGAMRQHHRHATAFVGRRHFDDPDLLEQIYRWEER